MHTVVIAAMGITGMDEQTSEKATTRKGSKGPAVRLIIDVIRSWR